MESIFRFNLKSFCEEASRVTGDGSSVVALRDLNLNPREEYLLVRVLQPATAQELSNVLRRYSFFVKYWRDQDNQYPIFALDEIESLDWNKNFLSQEKTLGRLMRSIYVWDGREEYDKEIRYLLQKLEIASGGNFIFEDLEDGVSSLYIRLSAILFVEGMPFLDRGLQMYFFQSRFYLLTLMMDLDVEKAISRAMDDVVTFNNRHDLSQKFAIFLLSNQTALGFKGDGEPANVDYWVDKFRLFSAKKLDGISLLNFFSDKTNLDDYNSEEDIFLIKVSLTIYGYLVSGKYVLAVDSDTINKNVSIENKIKVFDFKIIKAELLKKYGDGKEIKDVGGAMVELDILSKRYNDPKILELYYYDEPTGEFKWQD